MKNVIGSTLALSAVAIGACTVSTPALHPMMHPSVRGDANGAGVGGGALYAFTAETGASSRSNVLVLPYGEGWARFGLGAGQLELRVGPGLGYLSYRANIVSAQEKSAGLALVTSMGLGYWRAWESGGRRGNDAESALALAPNLSLLLSFDEGRVYLSPRLGFLHLRSSSGGDTDSTGLIAGGLNVGCIVDDEPYKISLELGMQRVTSTDDNSEGAVYLIAPSVGVEL